MGKFAATKTYVKETDTLEKFEKKVKKALDAPEQNTPAITKLIDELDKKEGVWSQAATPEEVTLRQERCCKLRDDLESCVCGAEE